MRDYQIWDHAGSVKSGRFSTAHLIDTILIAWNPVYDEFLLTIETFTEGYKYYLCSAQSAEPCQTVPFDLVQGTSLHGFGWSSQGQYLSISKINLKPEDSRSAIQVYERHGFGNFKLVQSFPETLASAFVKDTIRDSEYLVLYDDKGFSYWDPRSDQWTRKPDLPNYTLHENLSGALSSTRHLLVRWDPFHIYASEINSKYFRFHFFDGALHYNFVDALPLNPGDFVAQESGCKGFRPASMQGSDTFCVQADVMRFPNVPFEVAGGTSWMYAAFNQGGVGVSNDTVMHHFAAETALKSHATGLNVTHPPGRRALRWLDHEQLVIAGDNENQVKAQLFNTRTRELSDYPYEPKGEHPFQWNGRTYSGVHNFAEGGRSVVFPELGERSSPLVLDVVEESAEHGSLFTDGLQTFFVARTKNTLQVYQLEEQGFALIQKIPQDSSSRSYVVWTDDGRYILQYETRKARLYERKGRNITFVSELENPDQYASCIKTDPILKHRVVLSLQGRFVCADTEKVSLIDPKSGDSTLIHLGKRLTDDRISDWRLSPDKRTLAVMDNSGRIMLFPTQAAEQRKELCLYLKDLFTSSNIFDHHSDFTPEDRKLCESTTSP
ncbi:MAG TPA: hypothetical protein VE954_02155 [Oligoflexus sp.]|uniref:hypothetical protein n=1 Tax=Oligoflexus sp. TaxID=1971216 RepID=UPI002D2C7E4F|nr:hypothetical protein [Oligoflexus sp.]HYX31889.1 hypothetical protein [Oligoflexus sp.]